MNPLVNTSVTYVSATSLYTVGHVVSYYIIPGYKLCCFGGTLTIPELKRRFFQSAKSLLTQHTQYAHAYKSIYNIVMIAFDILKVICLYFHVPPVHSLDMFLIMLTVIFIEVYYT